MRDAVAPLMRVERGEATRQPRGDPDEAPREPHVLRVAGPGHAVELRADRASMELLLATFRELARAYAALAHDAAAPAPPTPSAPPAGAGRAVIAPDHSRITLGEADVCLHSGLVRRGAGVLRLRPKELRLLQALVRAGGAIVSRQELLTRVWGYAPGVRSRTVDTHVAELRRKVGDAGEARYIESVRQLGYRLNLDAPPP